MSLISAVILTLTNSTLSGNSADNWGGGIYNYSGTLTLTNSTLSGNSADRGGGIYNNSGTLTLTNSTLSGNSADNWGGGIYDRGTLTLNNTIVVLNNASYSADIYGSFTNNSSLVGSMGVEPGFVRNPSAGRDGVWGTADDDGDLRLAATSLAINRGDNALSVDESGNTLMTDIEGNPRIAHGQVDIGAYEYQGVVSPLWESSSSVVTTLTDVVDTTDGEISLREAIIYSNFLDEDVTFAASLSGGTIILGGSELILSQSVTINATLIGGIVIDAAGYSRVMSITGGGDTEVFLIGLTITGGNAYYGGGIYKHYGTLTLNNSTLSGNSTEGGGGGGIYNDRGTLTLTDSTLAGNTTEGDGGGIYNNYGTLTLNNSTLSGNSAERGGGGIYNYNRGTLTLTNSTLMGNSAGDGGGGIYNSYDGTLTLTNSTLSGNSTEGDGGGIYNSGTLTLTDSTLSGNSASYWGGGIFNFGTLTVANSTLSGNSAAGSDRGGGGIFNFGTLTVTNTIVALNDASEIADISGIFTNNSSLIGVDPGFVRNPSAGTDGVWGTADDNYGDLRLATTSIAINRGDNSLSVDESGNLLMTDIEGNPRIVHGQVDIGAYEYQGVVSPLWESSSSVVTTLADVVDTTDGEISLREAIIYSDLLDEDVTFAASLSGGTIILDGSELILSQSVTINATSIGGITIDAAGQSRVMFIAGGDDTEVFLIGLTITGGNANSGGGIYNSGTVTVTNSTLSGNSAYYGGGIYNYDGTLTVTNSTLSGNSANSGGGIRHFSYDGTLTLNNTIVALNDASSSADVHGTFTNNSSLIGVDPQFVRNPSAGADGVWGTDDDDYGDLRLQRTSPAVDAGNNALLPVDQFDLDGDGDTTESLPIDLAGNPRVLYGTVDIGAYEGIFTPIVQEISIVEYDPYQVMRIVFSEAMETGTFDPSEDILSLIGAGTGHVLGYAWLDDTTLDLYCLLEAYGDYTLTLGPDIRSADGKWMDADMDDICGEFGEDNSILAVTMTPPYVTGHVVAEGLPINSVTVTFDRPMRSESFQLAEDIVSFDGPDGPMVVDSWRWLNEMTLELNVNLSTAEDYSLVLGSNILDRSGATLDNDVDLTPGEIGDDDYLIAFHIASPVVTSFNAPALPPVDGVTIHFSREMDTTSFSLAEDMLSFTGPAGDVTVTGFAWLDNQTLRLEIDDTGTGTYSFQLGGALLDVWGNALDGDGDGVAGEDEDGYTASFTAMMQGTITQDTTIGGPNAMIQIDGDLRIASGVTLTVLAGTVVKYSNASSGITVSGGGKLIAAGTAQSPVTFTSYLDDSVGGDTNGDGNATTPSYNNWRGVRIESNGQAELTHTEVRYASKAIDADSQYATANLSEVTLRKNNFGVYVYSPYAKITAENCLIVDNNSTGVFVRASSAHTFRNCTIVGNGFGGSGWYGAGIHVGAATVNLDNCIVAFNADGLHHAGADDSQTIIRNSIFHNPAGQNLIWAAGGEMPRLDQDGNMVVDPLFIDRTAGDYELAAGSPAIDSGLGFQTSPTDLSGAPRYDDPGMPNRGGGYPAYVDIGAFERQSATISGDLAVTNVSAPSSLFLSTGEAYSFQWTVANVGFEDIETNWQDVLYLSRNTTIDSGDVVLTTRDQSGGLAAGESYTDTYDGVAPAEAGPWYLLVRTNASDSFIEPNLADNLVASPIPLGVDVPIVEVGSNTSGSVSAGQWEYLQLDATVGNTIVLSLAGESGLKLYVSRGIPPTLNNYDFVADAAGELRILNPVDDTYYVGVYSQNNTGSRAFTVSAANTSLAIREVTTNVIGNTGTATVEIAGDNFDAGAQVQLIASDGTVIEAEEYFRNSGKLYATFDMAAASALPGQYDLRITNPDGTQVTQATAVTVELGEAPEFLADIHVPGTTRPGRVITLRIEYSNPTNVNIPSPIVTLDAGLKEFQWQLPGDDSWVTGTQFRFLALSSEGPATVLRPGQTEVIEIKARTPLEPGRFWIDVLSLGATSVDGSADLIDWVEFEADVRPNGMSDEDWAPALSNLKSSIGITWGDYVSALI